MRTYYFDMKDGVTARLVLILHPPPRMSQDREIKFSLTKLHEWSEVWPHRNARNAVFAES
jgi:hypothetical protein